MVKRTESQAAHTRVLDYLAAAMKERALAPGERLPTERRLAEQFTVTRSTVRRALDELESSGAIVRQVGRGTFVKPLRKAVRRETGADGVDDSTSPADYADARLRFEPEMIGLVVSHATGADFDGMEDCLKRSERVSTREEFELLDAEFHRLIAVATHNSLIVRMYELIHGARHDHAMWVALRQMGPVAEQRATFQREHRGIFEALKRRDAESAGKLMVEHIRKSRQRMLDY